MGFGGFGGGSGSGSGGPGGFGGSGGPHGTGVPGGPLGGNPSTGNAGPSLPAGPAAVPAAAPPPAVNISGVPSPPAAAAPMGAALATGRAFLSVPEGQQILAEMPAELRFHLSQLDHWAKDNQKEANNDKRNFWALKWPAILISSIAGISAALHFPTVVPVIIGAIGSVCVALDGILQPGASHKIHLRAVYDIRELENDIATQWLAASPRRRTESLGRRLTTRSKKTVEKITAYLRDADTGSSTHNRSHGSR